MLSEGEAQTRCSVGCANLSVIYGTEFEDGKKAEKKMSEFTQLLKEIETISENTHLPFERRLMDTAVWFHKSKDRIAQDDVFKRLEFTEKTLDITLELFAMCLQRMQQVEGRPKSENLWLPRGINGGGRHFG